MASSGRPSIPIKCDPAIKRIKKEEGGPSRLSSIPLALSTTSAKPKVENKHDRKPLQSIPSSNRPSKKNKRKNRFKKWYQAAGNACVQRGGSGDHVKAHFKKPDMIVELFVRRSIGATWQQDKESVEKDIFRQLNKTGLNIEPVDGWGFLGFLNDMPDAMSYVHGTPHKVIPVRMVQSSLKNEVKSGA